LHEQIGFFCQTLTTEEIMSVCKREPLKVSLVRAFKHTLAKDILLLPPRQALRQVLLKECMFLESLEGIAAAVNREWKDANIELLEIVRRAKRDIADKLRMSSKERASLEI
jgi:hypothetical protein